MEMLWSELCCAVLCCAVLLLIYPLVWKWNWEMEMELELWICGWDEMGGVVGWRRDDRRNGKESVCTYLPT